MKEKSKKKKGETQQITCPCCGEKRGAAGVSRTLALPYFAANGIQGLLQSRYQWACDMCLKKGKAIMGNPRKQAAGITSDPYLAYFDRTVVCRSCGKPFVFSGSEQHHWYEKLGFTLKSWPVKCKACNKK